MYLAGDIGGTNTRLALFEKRGSSLHLRKEQKLASTSWDNLQVLLWDFLDWAQEKPQDISASCLSLAGPIESQTCRLVNLNRNIDLSLLQDSILYPFRFFFCNDLVATGHGIFTLGPKDLYCLNPSVINSTHQDSATELIRAVIAPGTGLGESIIFREDLICPTEGAHVDFAPRSEREVKLWRFLAKEYGHVSYERVLSGPGLVNIYRFLSEEIFPANKDSSIPSPAEITEKALSKAYDLSVETLELFIELLGAEAGNLALKSLSLGGIYIGGGIAPKILPQLKQGSFLKAFHAKGRFSELLRNIPVYVILNEKAALHGAARIAMLSES